MIYGGDLMSNFAGSIMSKDYSMTKDVVLSKLHKLIKDEPKFLISILKISGVKIKDESNKKELIDKSVDALFDNKTFQEELSKALLESSGYENALDPVTAIADAVGNIFKFASNKTEQKTQKDLAKQQLQMQLLQGEQKKTNWLPIVIIGGVLLIGGAIAIITLKGRGK